MTIRLMSQAKKSPLRTAKDGQQSTGVGASYDEDYEGSVKLVVETNGAIRNMVDFVDTLPTGFSYDCSTPLGLLTFPGVAPQVFLPKDHVVRCVEGDNTNLEVEWELPEKPAIPPGTAATLTFNAVTSLTDGNYFNQAEVVPGENKTSNGNTASVQIGTSPGSCTGDAVLVAKVVDSASPVSTHTSTSPYTYTFNVDFTIKIDNVGTQNLTIKELIDYLPESFSYISTNPSGDLTQAPEQIYMVGEINRQQVKWKPDPEAPLVSGASKTLIFSTTAALITIATF